MNSDLTGYDAKYANGQGWKYNASRETVVVRDIILKPLALSPGSRVLEIGCGEGFHANLLRIQGMLVDAVDISKPAILNARKDYPFRSITFRCDDVRNLPDIYRDGAFSLIFCRAMSWFHRNLDESAYDDGLDLHREMSRLMPLLKPGGFFCLQVCTDFSGEVKHGVHMNTADGYARFFERHGTIVSFCDWRGAPLDPVAPSAPFGGIILTVRRVESGR